MKKILRYSLLVIVLVITGFLYYRYFFVFATGVKAGELNYIMNKGMIWKTNEGRLIQAGYKSGVNASIQSNEFKFSVTDEKVMHQLETSSGNMLQLHYKQYIGTLPWRGMSNFIVDSVISNRQATSQSTILP